MIREELRDIVMALLDKARANEVNWVPAADLGLGGAENDVVVSLPDYSINIFDGRDSETDNYFIAVNLLNRKGKFITGVALEQDDVDYVVLQELLNSGIRKVSGVDEAIATLKHLLRQPGPIGQALRKTPKDDDDLPF